ncbi:MAG: bifunctional (p)ppGpp synthetase/guanosine-3',5'-bis(diphosphate) 3'-pyrophosphohydrolase [Magnetococcales bacterium]|nr:bifunctional (p)ppGpp synthetase/guanosine-3',5'-bis(diphosphate) 3'-pyrophosphohydrolase [Magnetococcales bacterium]
MNAVEDHNTLLEKAITLAVTHHNGQRDKAGAPYVMHPLRLMMQFQDAHLRMVAVLHDVVEDTPVTLDDLRRDGFPETVIVAVDALSHREGESRARYLERVRSNSMALRVKLADLEDNMDLRRISEPNDWDWKRMARYRKTWEMLKQEYRKRFHDSEPRSDSG